MTVPETGRVATRPLYRPECTDPDPRRTLCEFDASRWVAHRNTSMEKQCDGPTRHPRAADDEPEERRAPTGSTVDPTQCDDHSSTQAAITRTGRQPTLKEPPLGHREGTIGRTTAAHSDECRRIMSVRHVRDRAERTARSSPHGPPGALMTCVTPTPRPGSHPQCGEGTQATAGSSPGLDLQPDDTRKPL